MKIEEEYKKGNVLVLGFEDTNLLHRLNKDYNALFGVSFDSKAVQNAYEEGFQNVFNYNITNIKNLFSDNLFDTIILDHAIHKVFTLNQNQGFKKSPINGGKKVVLMMSQVWDILHENGILIIEDTLKPSTAFRYDTISYEIDDDFEDFLNDMENIKLSAEDKNKRTMSLLDFLLLSERYLNKNPNEEYFPFDIQELEYYLSMIGFQTLEVNAFVEDKTIDFANKISFFNLSHENILPNTLYQLKLRKK